MNAFNLFLMAYFDISSTLVNAKKDVTDFSGGGPYKRGPKRPPKAALSWCPTATKFFPFYHLLTLFNYY